MVLFLMSSDRIPQLNYNFSPHRSVEEKNKSLLSFKLYLESLLFVCFVDKVFIIRFAARLRSLMVLS